MAYSELIGKIIVLKLILSAAIVLSSTTAVYAKHEERKFLESEINCLGDAIFRESRSEPLVGKVLVGEVVMNRLKHKSFPKTVCGVVHQKGHKHGRLICQFSWACMNLPPIPRTGKERFDSYYLARMIYNHELKDISKGSLFFFKDNELKYVKQMKIALVTKVGQHGFYKERV